MLSLRELKYSVVREKWDSFKNRPSTSNFFRALQRHWSRMKYPGIIPKIQPSARNQYVLDPYLKIETPAPSEVASDKKKMNPRHQRKYAVSKPRYSFKNLPKGWTREKVARAYETAPLRGIPKSTWLE